ncbi:ABC transporter substrate-binding protein [Halarchaeum salinum]|uniref:Fe/B12 periplasmic-binding domain-containing protein n=1 Tax=Halarchaeum salinum TaxID=489912 RepID=A0AAV3S8B4_9EURY
MKRQLCLVALVLVATLAGPTGGALATTTDDTPSAIDVPTAATNNTTDDTNTTDTNTTDTNTTDTNTTDTNTTDTNTTDTNTTDTNTTDTNTTDTNTTDTNTTDTNTTYSTVPSTCTYPFTSTDATGTSVTVEGAPERIVVVGGSATQTLWEIGAQERVVGLWDSSYTAYLDNASAKPNVANSFGYAEVPAVLNQSPDMVLLANIQHNKTAQRLRQAGITTYKFEAASSIEDIYAKTRLTGHLVGNCTGAENTVSWMQDRLNTVEEVRERADSTPTMFYPMAGSYTAGSGTFVSDVMRLGGAHNVALDAGITGYKPYSEGFILKQSPEWLLATYSLPEHGEAQNLLPKTQEINQTEAYREDRVVAVNANYVSQPAPRVVYAIEEIAQIVHPDAWAAVHGRSDPIDDDDDNDVDWADLQDDGSSDAATNETAMTNETAANASAGSAVTLVRENGSVTATVRNATGTVSFDLTKVTGANASANVSANLTAANASLNATAANASTNATTLTGANVSLRAGTNASELTFTASDPTTAVPTGAAALDEATPMRYFSANVSGVDADAIATATLRFHIAPADLPNGTEPADVALYRYHNASWNSLPTEHLNGSAYAATTPGFSAFAIGASNETAAQNATSTTGAENTTGTSTVSLNVTSTTATNATTTANTTTTTATSTSSGSSPGFGPTVAVLALSLVAFLLRRR